MSRQLARSSSSQWISAGMALSMRFSSLFTFPFDGPFICPRNPSRYCHARCGSQCHARPGHDRRRALQEDDGAGPLGQVAGRAQPVGPGCGARQASELAGGTALVARPRVSVIDQILRNADPFGELTITVPDAVIDELATVIELELGAAPQ